MSSLENDLVPSDETSEIITQNDVAPSDETSEIITQNDVVPSDETSEIITQNDVVPSVITTLEDATLYYSSIPNPADIMKNMAPSYTSRLIDNVPPSEISAQKCPIQNNINIVSTDLTQDETHIDTIILENHMAMEQLSNDNIDGITCKYSVFENSVFNLSAQPFYTTEQLNTELPLSERTKNILNTHLNSLLAKKDKINIVEIGVSGTKYTDNITSNSTGILTSNKRQGDIYVGIDITPKSLWNDSTNNIFTIHSASEYVDANINELNNIGVSEIDLLFIDGWRSIEQLYSEWKYTKILSNVGVVLINCVNLFSGPYFLVKSIDDTKYDIYRYLSDVKDNGICAAVRK